MAAKVRKSGSGKRGGKKAAGARRGAGAGRKRATKAGGGGGRSTRSRKVARKAKPAGDEAVVYSDVRKQLRASLLRRLG